MSPYTRTSRGSILDANNYLANQFAESYNILQGIEVIQDFTPNVALTAMHVLRDAWDAVYRLTYGSNRAF